uniref:Transposase Tc1-like domain-containing protein n=1 Tax=Monopterus albus TaxID=43700 RepID=A0A3Q3J165_MONAL
MNTQERPTGRYDALKVDLKEKGIEVSSSTVRRRLLEVGRKAYRPVKKQLLTKAMKVKRYKWALKYKNWTKEDWRKVLFSDESHFFVQGQRSQHVRRSPTEKLCNAHIDQRVKHPQKKMFWGCFSYYGIGSLHPVEGMMRSPQYIELLQRKVAPELIKLFPDGSGVFQQDLALCHTSKQPSAWAVHWELCCSGRTSLVCQLKTECSSVEQSGRAQLTNCLMAVT